LNHMYIHFCSEVRNANFGWT